MFPEIDNFYARRRVDIARAGAFHEQGGKAGQPTERLLQAIWQHQRLQRDRLRTMDGRPIRVFHPGFVSVEGGPDFYGAVVQFGDEPPRAGDVEVDLHSAGWRSHGHDQNKNFENVLLHVVWNETKAPAAGLPAVLSLKNVLDAPVDELARALENEPLRSLPENLRGKCSGPLRELAGPRLTELLHAAAEVRFQNKAAAMLTRARNSGWEQALWENLFRALGYKHNVWPMQNLAETKGRWACGASTPFEIQARLLGLSGLLPGELTRPQKNSDTFLRRAWDVWWRDRDEFESCRLPRAAWKFHGLRPANHPQRRLALAAHWLASENLVSKIEGWCVADVPDRKLPASLREIFQVERDEFWSWHWTLKSARMKRPQPLLGEMRLTDLAVNVVLPWLWSRSACGRPPGGEPTLQRKIKRRFLAWPAGEDNSVLKLARQRLLGTTNARALGTAAAQQGLMQIVRDFCTPSNAVCADCPFPGLVCDWRTRAAT